ncbi:MAG: P1 family peptidase [Dehalococcoidia bacterium]
MPGRPRAREFGLSFGFYPVGAHNAISPLFAATVEASEEAVINALFAAETTVGRNGNILHALPLDRVWALLGR